MSGKLESLLSSEEKTREVIDGATREARKIRTRIPLDVIELKNKYSLSLQEKESVDMATVQKKLDALQKKQNSLLEKSKTNLSLKSESLAPHALKLMHSAVEGEKG